jgi:hypothetical protein
VNAPLTLTSCSRNSAVRPDEYARIARADDRSTDSIVALADPAPTEGVRSKVCVPTGAAGSVR